MGTEGAFECPLANSTNDNKEEIYFYYLSLGNDWIKSLSITQYSCNTQCIKHLNKAVNTFDLIYWMLIGYNSEQI